MARPIWKGSISFGLVNIPVGLYSAEKSNELSFHLLDNRNKARVRYDRVNEATGEKVPWDQIVRGYEYDKGEYVVMEDEDFKRAAVEATQTVEIQSFTERNAIDSVYFEQPYYLVPDKKGQKGYVLLRESLKRSGKIAVAKVVIRTREHLAAVIPEGDALVLDLLRFQEELRDVSEFDLPGSDLKEQKISSREVDMALQLVDSMTAEWDPAQYQDEYRSALLSFIEKKAKAGGRAVPPQGLPSEEKARGEVIDMMELLKRSLEKKRTRGEAAAESPSEAAASPASGKKTARRPAAARPHRAPGKKTGASAARSRARSSRRAG
jgi:DNA end-binding protein Ku